MRLSSLFSIVAVFFVAAVFCLMAARFAVTAIEDGSRTAVLEQLDSESLTWTEVDANGLQIFLAGTAPSEALRFKALTLAGKVVDAARVIDQMLVEDSSKIAPPRFSIEILRNDSGVSLIGLVPSSTDRDDLVAEIAEQTEEGEVIDLLESADYTQPDTWQDAVDFAVRSLSQLPRAKISVDAERVMITAMADNERDKRRIETDLARRVPDDVRLGLEISSPRPVITPFTLRVVIEGGQPRFDACSADTEEARDRILAAAGKVGLTDKVNCTIGLGVPSPKWARAVEQSIAAMGKLGNGSVTFSDADISLIAAEGTPQAGFDDVVGQLETSLPEVFALHAVLPQPEDTTQVTPEFVATLSPEGLVQIRGRVDSDVTRETVNSFAKARFASDAVHSTARVAEGLPKNWSLRVLTGLETLSYLSNGAVIVKPEELSVSGHTGQQDASAMIAGFLSDKLGEQNQFSIDVTYKEELDPVASRPTPDECEARIAEVQADDKINFEPGSANIDANGSAIMDRIAEILSECGEIRMEIQGHTDSQGREVMNEQLSQSRARAVLNELRLRRVLTSSFTAKGYGESDPIADNNTEEGREANRRIKFKLIRPEPIKPQVTTLESLEDPVENQDEAGDTGDQEGTQDEQN
jgi:OOP family OmpA-OmpF porin